MSALVIAFLTGRPMLMMAEKLPLLELGSIRVPARSLSRSEARISAAAGTGPSTRTRTLDGDGFGAMSGTSKREVGEVDLASRRRVGDALADRHERGAPGHLGLQIGIANRRHLVHGTDRHARCDDVDGKPLVGNRRTLARKVAHRRIDARRRCAAAGPFSIRSITHSRTSGTIRIGHIRFSAEADIGVPANPSCSRGSPE